MKEQMLDEVVARRFLLGQLPPDEQGRIEELAFDDPQSFEVLQAAEDDLIDEFVYDDLSSEDRQQFQEYYLAQPGRREDLRIAKALRKHFDREQATASVWTRVRTWFQLGAAPLMPVMAKAAAIIAVAAIGLMALMSRISGPGIDPLPQIAQQQPSPIASPASTVSETPSPHPSRSPAPSQNKPPAPHWPPAQLAILISPGSLTRGSSGVTPVPLTSRAKHLDLPLVDGTSYRSYQATLEHDGTTLKTWSNLKPKGKRIRIPIPFDLLKVSQRYYIVLQGVAPDGNLKQVNEYHFEATK